MNPLLLVVSFWEDISSIELPHRVLMCDDVPLERFEEIHLSCVVQKLPSPSHIGNLRCVQHIRLLKGTTGRDQIISFHGSSRGITDHRHLFCENPACHHDRAKPQQNCLVGRVALYCALVPQGNDDRMTVFPEKCLWAIMISLRREKKVLPTNLRWRKTFVPKNSETEKEILRGIQFSIEKFLLLGLSRTVGKITLIPVGGVMRQVRAIFHQWKGSREVWGRHDSNPHPWAIWDLTWYGTTIVQYPKEKYDRGWAYQWWPW